MERTRLGALLFLFRGRRLVVVAFVLSLLVHLTVASGMRWPFTPPQEDVQTVHIEHLHTIRIAHMPTPPPSTPPPVTPAPHESPAATAKPARVSSTLGEGHARAVARVAATVAPSSAPTPRPTPSATCSGSDTAASIVEKPSAPPDIAPAVRGQATSGVTQVRVTLDATGAVKGTAIAQSSGNNSLDFLAMAMAREARYAPATHDCKAVASEYLFSAKFVAW